jgi:His-Xaa-Ser system protein HxsD
MPVVGEPIESTVEVSFSSAVFSLDVLKKAAYRFLDRFSTEFKISEPEIVCVLHFPGGASQDTIERDITGFRAEVLDQDLRRLVANETAGVRNTILSLAFSSTDLVGRE